MWEREKESKRGLRWSLWRSSVWYLFSENEKTLPFFMTAQGKEEVGMQNLSSSSPHLCMCLCLPLHYGWCFLNKHICVCVCMWVNASVCRFRWLNGAACWTGSNTLPQRLPQTPLTVHRARTKRTQTQQKHSSRLVRLVQHTHSFSLFLFPPLSLSQEIKCPRSELSELFIRVLCVCLSACVWLCVCQRVNAEGICWRWKWIFIITESWERVNVGGEK